MEVTFNQVTKGAKLLDKKFPGWEKKIDPEILDMANPSVCILGQLHGDYATGSVKLFPLSRTNAEDRAMRYGFDSLEESYGPSYEQLNCAWMLEIAKRLSPKWQRKQKAR